MPASRLPEQDYGAEVEERWEAGARLLRAGSVMIDGRRLAYVEAGAGESTCVLLHGIGNTWRFWTAVVAELAQGRRVVAFDLPGFGGSDPPPGPLDAEGVGRVLFAGCTSLGIGRAAWCGHSMGALVALACARQEPERVDRVAVVGGALVTVLGFYSRPRSVLAHPLRAATYAASIVSGALPAPAFALDAVAGRAALRAVVLAPYLRHPGRLPAASIRSCLEGVGGAGVLRAAANTGDFDLEATARAVRQRVLVVNGDRDRFVSLGDVEQLARWLPQPSVAVIDDAGHWPMIERPAVLAPMLDRFLRD